MIFISTLSFQITDILLQMKGTNCIIIVSILYTKIDLNCYGYHKLFLHFLIYCCSTFKIVLLNVWFTVNADYVFFKHYLMVEYFLGHNKCKVKNDRSFRNEVSFRTHFSKAYVILTAICWDARIKRINNDKLQILCILRVWVASHFIIHPANSFLISLMMRFFFIFKK